MTWTRALVVMACLLAAGCDEDPASAVRIIARPVVTIVVPSPTPLVRAGDWHPEACPPPPEDAPGPSTLTVAGPCAFEHHGAVSCEVNGDDFLITMTRPAAGGAKLMIYINVEQYHGPGSYEGAQMFMGVQDKTLIYRWSSDTVSITVGPDETSAELPTTRIEAEPLLIDCSGPMTNYDCSGRGDMPLLEASTAVLSGTLRCAERFASQ